MNELLNLWLLSELRRFDEAIMNQFEGGFCFEIYHWNVHVPGSSYVTTSVGRHSAELSISVPVD